MSWFSKASWKWHVCSSGRALAIVGIMSVRTEGLLQQNHTYNHRPHALSANLLVADEECSRHVRRALSWAVFELCLRWIVGVRTVVTSFCKAGNYKKKWRNMTNQVKTRYWYQRFLLQVAQVVGAYSKVRKKWFLMGRRMSPKCVVAVLGLGNSRLARVISGRKDRRFHIWGGVLWCNSGVNILWYSLSCFICCFNVSFF